MNRNENEIEKETGNEMEKETRNKIRNEMEQAISGIDDRYIQEAVQYTEKRGRASYRWVRRLGTAAACALIAFGLSVSTLSAATAAGSEPAYEILYRLYPEIAKKLSPVNVSCEDNGIRMSVESVYVHGDTAQVYISMQDLTGDRVDGTIDLFDSYDIHTSRDSIGTCSLVSCDEQEKLATFLVTVQHMAHESITGDRMTFSAGSFLSGKKETERELTELSPGEIGATSDTQSEVSIRGWAGPEHDSELVRNLSGYLTENSGQSFSPAEGVRVTAWGLIDGKLHVQAYYEDILHTDNHGYIYLKTPDGTTIDCLENVAFWDEEGVGSYEEYIFDVGEEITQGGWSVWGDFVTSSRLTTGDWRVTFPIINRE